jgi:hypothetical protein
MKARTYIRVAKLPNGKPKIASGSKPSPEPLKDSYGEALATVAFAVEFNVPDEAFRRAEQLIATVEITSPEPLATVRQIDQSAVSS